MDVFVRAGNFAKKLGVAAGHSVQETAEIIQHPFVLVQQWHKNYLQKHKGI